jgi:fibronectin type 3 domain-containing protein
MQQIAPQTASDPNAETIVAPAFRDLHVQPGHAYRYAVTAVDASGNESPRSAEVSAVIPTS